MPARNPQTQTQTRLEDRKGFVMPVVLFTMVIMSVMAVAAIEASLDQARSSSAVRRSGESFYAAESGVYAVISDWNDTASTLDSVTDAMSSGGILDLGWDTLPSGGTFHAEIIRLNESGDAMFLLNVSGRDAGEAGGERNVSMLLTAPAGKFALGDCCESAAVVRAGVDVNSGTGISGTDTNPPFWGDTCSDHVREDKPGLLIEAGMGLDSLEISSSGFIRSGDSVTNDESYLPVPAVVIDSSINDATFNLYGAKTWQEVKDMATSTIGEDYGDAEVIEWGGDPATDDSKFGPRYHNTGDGHGHSGGDPIIGTCDTTHRLNFGAPSGPCATHFPIVIVDGEVELKDQGYDDFPDDVDAWELWHAQGVFILDTLSTGEGSEFELESPGNFAGIFIGKGCIQLQDGSQSYGALFMDGLIGADSCGTDMPLEMEKGDNSNYPHTDLYYSGCVVREVLRATGLGEAAGAGGGVGRVGVRSFSELLR